MNSNSSNDYQGVPTRDRKEIIFYIEGIEKLRSLDTVSSNDAGQNSGIFGQTENTSLFG